MEKALELVKEALLCASSEIAEEYLALPVAGSQKPTFRERVYCYELYHRWRCHWPNQFKYSLGGEISKARHSEVRGEHLNNTMPDFVVHIPGEMKNLLVMEVKSKKNKVKDVVKDLKKLTAFLRLKDKNGNPANYHAAYFWVYGIQKEQWERDERKKVLEAIGNQDEVEFKKIRYFIHEEVGTRAVEVNGNDLLSGSPFIKNEYTVEFAAVMSMYVNCPQLRKSRTRFPEFRALVDVT